MSLLQKWRLERARRACRLPLQQRLLHQQSLPSLRARVADVETIALDFETTGLDAQRDHVIAAGWVRIRGDRIVMASAREVHVRTHGPDGVGQSAVIHGILDSDLEHAASGETLLEQLLPDVAGCVVVAHAAAIERAFLAALLRRLGGVPLPNPFIDTMALERRLIEGAGGSVRELHGDLTMDACRGRHGLPDHQRHSAGADAVACAELFIAQVAQLGGAGIVRLRELR
ncbi:MAG TPA: exonuclease domain-containing protein [Steroidobacteraceae bacterium]|nr:exonuclease domain-containing protein [Steroidobacteraceae bacterium]